MERHDAFHLLRSGFRWSPDKAADAEMRVGISPDAVAERLPLVGYYWSKSCANDRFAEDWCRHVVELIRRDPSANFIRMPFLARPASRCRAALLKVRDEWVRQMELHPASVEIIDSAALFFAELDPSISDKLLVRASQLDGNRGRWAHRRALLLSEQVRGGLSDRNLIRTRIEELERTCFEPADKEGRSYLSAELARCAFAAGLDDAARLAQIAVTAGERSDRRVGFDDPLHDANIILGRIAMRSGDATGAARFLLRAANVRLSPHPEPLGPDVVLAEALLAAGHRDAVAEYFTICASRWAEGREMLQGWAHDIRKGRTPELPSDREHSNGRVWTASLFE